MEEKDLSKTQNGHTKEPLGSDVSSDHVNAEPSTSIRVLQTMVMYLAFFSLGIAGAIVGPTLLDLEQLTGTDTEQVAWVMTSRCVGGLLGVALMGVVLARANPWLLMGVAQTLAAVMLAACPLFKNIIIMCLVFVVHGSGRWFVDGACNVMILAVWGQANGPWMQGLHCTSGIGAILAPLIASPFLTARRRHPDDITNNVTSYNMTSYSNATDAFPSTPHTSPAMILGNISDLGFEEGNLHVQGWKLFMAYCISGMTLLVSALCMFFLFCLRNRYPDIKRTTTHAEKKLENKNDVPLETKQKKNTPKWNLIKSDKMFHFQMLFLVALFDAVVCLVAVNYGNFVFSFAVKYLDWTNNAALSVTSAYWGSFIGGRGLAVAISKVLHPARLLLLCILLGLASSIPLLIFARAHPAVLWACTVGFGIAMSPMFATSVSLMGRYIRVSGPEGAVLVTATLIGEMTGPVLVSLLFGRYGPMALVYVMFGVSCLLLVISVLIHIAGKRGEPEERDVTVTLVQQEDKPIEKKVSIDEKIRV